MRVVLLVSYDGTDFCGWQRQPGRRTVQSVMEEAAREIFGKATVLTASGRTDSGVHAMGQVVMCDAETTIPPEKLAACFNRLLPDDVKVLESRSLPGFDCTGAKRKTYVYHAYHSATEQPLLRRYCVRLAGCPDPEKMSLAANLLVGEHDFAAFRSSGFTSKTSVRELFEVKTECIPVESFTLYRITVTGNGFLYNMVRIIAGELFAVGSGKPQGITEAFLTKDRSKLAKTMPPQGLCLLKVDYGLPIFGK